MTQLLIGAIGMAALIAGALFARFWRRTRDRLFLYFAASFWLEGISRFLMSFHPRTSEEAPLVYFIRLVAYLLIVVAIVEKNRTRSSR